MSKQLGIIIIHGMGSQTKSFADGTMQELKQRIKNEHGKNPNAIAWEAVYWADVLENRERAYYAKVKKRVEWQPLRKFVITAFGDAVAYQQMPGEFNTTYQEIHERVRQKINLVQARLGADDKPLIIMAHSLGAVIMSNYIWDIQHYPQKYAVKMSDFEKMKSLAGIITFGCNLPLFSFAYKDIKAIEFPSHALTPELARKAAWLNFYDPDDVLGYPLKQISPSYNKAVTKDIAINVGGLLTSWNPAAHEHYWTDGNFINEAAEFIASFL